MLTTKYLGGPFIKSISDGSCHFLSEADSAVLGRLDRCVRVCVPGADVLCGCRRQDAPLPVAAPPADQVALAAAAAQVQIAGQERQAGGGGALLSQSQPALAVTVALPIPVAVALAALQPQQVAQ